jgi:lysozyme
MAIDLAKSIHKKEVGLRPNPYIDTLGQRMIGYGHKLQPNEKSPDEWKEPMCETILSEDIKKVLDQIENCPQNKPGCQSLKNAYSSGSDTVKAVIIAMGLQLGYEQLLFFYKAWKKLGQHDNVVAVAEMRNSLWAKQTEDRANRYMDAIINDRYDFDWAYNKY